VGAHEEEAAAAEEEEEEEEREVEEEEEEGGEIEGAILWGWNRPWRVLCPVNHRHPARISATPASTPHPARNAPGWARGTAPLRRRRRRRAWRRERGEMCAYLAPGTPPAAPAGTRTVPYNGQGSA
jgi:hypothetical protein